MEALDRALARESSKLDKRVLQPAVVNSLTDIKVLIAELDPTRNSTAPIIPLNTQMEVRDGSNVVVYGVATNTQSKSKRDYLIEGLKIIQNRQETEKNAAALIESAESVEINGRIMSPSKLGNAVAGHAWVDPLIHQWLGGSRDGCIIYWDLRDGYRYKYDIFQHKLTRSKNETSGQPTVGTL